MKLVTQWDVSPLVGPRPFYQLLLNPDPSLENWLPPLMPRWEAMLRERRNFIAKQIDRGQLARSLKESHERRGAPASTMAAIEQLNHPDVYLIVAGQQPGLLGGPLLAVYKILHAIVLAEQMTRERPETYLPAYWNAAEDHDFREIAVFKWLTKDKTLATFTWPGDARSRRPYFRIPQTECPWEALLQQLQSSLHPTEFVASILEAIRACARQAEWYPDFIDRLIWTMFPNEGLLILRPDDPFVREAARPVMEREILWPAKAAAGVEALGGQWGRRGYPVQLHKRADRASFFLIEEDQRIPLRIMEDGRFAGESKTYTRDALRRRLERQPGAFSSSAILRPVIQDAVFPTAGFVLGPSEAGYHLLLRDVYEHHGVPRPVLVPRFGCTLIEGREMNLLERYGLAPGDWLEHPAALVKRITRAASAADWSGAKASLEAALAALFENWMHQAREADPTIVAVLEKNLGRIRKEIENSESLLVRRLADNETKIREHIESLRNALVPESGLQERIFNIFPYLMKYGMEFMEELKKQGRAVPAGEHALVLVR